MSEPLDQFAHSLVCAVVGVGAGLLLGWWGLPFGALIQFYREEGQHGFKAVVKGEKGALDMLFGTLGGIIGTALAVLLFC